MSVSLQPVAKGSGGNGRFNIGNMSQQRVQSLLRSSTGSVELIEPDQGSLYVMHSRPGRRDLLLKANDPAC